MAKKGNQPYPQYENPEKEESLEDYYYRQQGGPNRNEVIPTWRKPPSDRDAEPENYNWEGASQKDRWGISQTFEEAQDDPPQKKPRSSP